MAVLTEKEAAEKLATRVRNIRRLRCKGHLRGAKLGTSSHRRYTDGDLEAYCEAGAPDYDEPPESAHGQGYDASENDFLRSQIESHIWEAASNQFRSADSIHAARLSGETPQSFTLGASSNLTHVLTVPLPEPTKIDRNRAESLQRRFATRGDFFLTMYLRGEFLKSRVALDKLFDSPEAYEELTGEVVDRMKARQLVHKVSYSPTPPQAAELRERGLAHNTVEVSYMLPLGVLLAGNDSRIVALAF